MEKDYGIQIESLEKEMSELKKLVKRLVESGNISSDGDNNGEKAADEKEFKKVHPMRNMHPDSKLSRVMERLCKLTDEEDRTGSITYLGVFTSGGRQSNWIRNEINTDELLTLIENETAPVVLQSIGSKDRLNLLLALLKNPMNVTSLTEKCAFGSTGQVYHHLKPLIAADIVTESVEEKGVYVVKPHRVQGIIMLLAGISDLMDDKYSQGSWE